VDGIGVGVGVADGFLGCCRCQARLKLKFGVELETGDGFLVLIKRNNNSVKSSLVKHAA